MTYMEDVTLELQHMLEPGLANKANAITASHRIQRRFLACHALIANEAAANTASDECFWRNPNRVKLVSARIVPKTTLVGDGTDYANVQITIDDDAGGSDTVVAYARVGASGDVANITGGRTAALTVVTASSANLVAANAAWHFVTVKGGSGQIVPISRIMLEYEEV